MSNSTSKFDRGLWINDPIEEFELLDPSNADCGPPHLRERITVWLRNLDAFAEVTLVRIYPDGLVVRQYCGGGDR